MVELQPATLVISKDYIIEPYPHYYYYYYEYYNYYCCCYYSAWLCFRSNDICNHNITT